MSRKVYNIFLAEDQLYIRKIVQINLEKTGMFKLLTADTGTNALKSIMINDEIDLFLLDIMMPEMTGIELCAEIRKIEKYKETPIVMLTALSTKQKVLEAIEAGANDYVTKPFQMKDLRGKVCSNLDIKVSFEK